MPFGTRETGALQDFSWSHQPKYGHSSLLKVWLVSPFPHLWQIPHPQAVLSQSSHGFLLYYEGFIAFCSLVHLGSLVSSALSGIFLNDAYLASVGFQGENDTILQLCTSEAAEFFPQTFYGSVPPIY